MGKITITLPDGSRKEHRKGVTGLEVAQGIGPRLAKDAVAVAVDSELRDLHAPLEKDCALRIITLKDKEGLDALRHSIAHLLAAAVMEMWPDTKRTIGPAIENGFYFDFEFSHPITEGDLPKIEAKMREILPSWDTFERRELSAAEAKKDFKGNPFKIELIEEFSQGAKKVSFYTSGGYSDLCKGGHLPSMKMAKQDAFKLTHIAGAYWRGSEKNPMLTRIYGVAFANKKDLDGYLKQQEEAAKRDHKKLGRELGLFMTHELVGKGLPIWLPKGEIIKREIENFAIEMERRAGYQRVSTPMLGKKELFVKSGHLPYYAESMFPEMKLDDGSYYLKAMNCPHHHLIFSHKARSYRELPLRISEYGLCHRYELSGTLSGLLRVRMLSMNDAHIYCTKDQIEEEFSNVIQLVVKYYAIFGLEDYHFRLSLHDSKNKEKYIGEPKSWAYTEEILRSVLKKLKVKFVEAVGEAAFYGPKVDIQYRAVSGREETMSTIQLDFAAKERFGLKYADSDGKDNSEVYVIHRAPLSTHERFISFLIELYAGKFPLWLAPEQVRIVTVSDASNEYADSVAQKLSLEGIRVEVDKRSESIPRKVREAQLDYVPLIVTVGEKEASSGTVAVRTLDGKVRFGIATSEFLDVVKKCILEKKRGIDI